MRHALEHMGGQRLSLASGSHGGASRNSGSQASTRHRYVRDGEVPVVHAALGRAVTRPDASLPQDKALIETMRQDLERERAAHEAAERSLHETRSALVAAQTRLAHVEMDLQAAKEATQGAVQEAADQSAIAQAAVAQAASLSQAAAQAQSAAQTQSMAQAQLIAEARCDAQARSAARTASVPAGAEASLPVRRRPRTEKTEREPQPVKWWVKA